MAGVKYIKKTVAETAAEEEKPAPRRGRAAAAPKPEANTKAKVTKKPETDEAVEGVAKKRGRPKAAEAEPATNGTKKAPAKSKATIPKAAAAKAPGE